MPRAQGNLLLADTAEPLPGLSVCPAHAVARWAVGHPILGTDQQDRLGQLSVLDPELGV